MNKLSSKNNMNVTSKHCRSGISCAVIRLVVLACCWNACAAFAVAEEKQGKFKAIALKDNGDVYRLWVYPNSEKATVKKMEAGYFPGVYVEGLGIFRLGVGFDLISFSFGDVPGFDKIVSIDLSFTEIKSSDLAHLAKCKKLSAIVLDHTAVSPMDLQVLAKLSDLRLVNVVGLKATKDEIEALRLSLPKAIIEQRTMGKIDSILPE